MSGLRRDVRTPRLLSRAGGKNWATEADHETSAPQQGTTGRRSLDTNRPQIDEDDEDINRDPDSDSDSDGNDKENTKDWRLPSPKVKIRAPRGPGRKVNVNIHTGSTKKVQSKAVKPEFGTSGSLHDEAEENIFGSSQPSQSSQKRSRGKATYEKGLKKPRTDTREKQNEAKVALGESNLESVESIPALTVPSRPQGAPPASISAPKSTKCNVGSYRK